MNNMITNEVVNDSTNMIYSIIGSYTKKYDKDDLIQAGRLGLMEAYQNFDPSYGVKFTTYAYSYIKGAILKYISEDKLIKKGRDISKLQRKIEEARTVLSQQLMRNPTTTELSLFLDIDEDELNIIEMYNYNFSSLDESVNDKGKELTLHDIIPSKENYDLNDLLALKEELSTLSKNEREIINYRYFKNLTQSEVAKVLGINQVKVSRMEDKILTNIKSRLN